MKRVFIDNQKGVVVVNGRKIPSLLLGIIRGAVGKSFVVKHYKGGRVVVAKYPDMSGIVPSVRQQERRALFREAVVYARWMVGDEKRKKAFRKTLPRKKRKQVYQAATRLFMSMQGDARWLRKQLAVKAMMRSGETEIIGVKVMTRMEHEDVVVRRINGERPRVNGIGKRWERKRYDQLDYGWVNRIGQTEDVFVKCSDAVW